MLRLLKMEGGDVHKLHEVVAFQLNDTHPSIAVAELMRIFVDEFALNWDESWKICQKVFAYTNHTLLPEALEKWPLDLFGSVLPRHLEIIYEINRRFLEEVRAKAPGDEALLERVSLIDESGPRYVRMAHLAVVGSHAVNGVAELHSELLKKDVLRDFYQLYPEKFYNVTNGVTPRRWVLLSNPRMSKLISSKIGDNWVKHLDELKGIEKYAEDPEFCEAWRLAKHEAKRDFANEILSQQNILIDPRSLFDVQVKRIHEYKRQHLNVLHIITLYNRLKKGLGHDMVPRTFIFGGKAAPGYFMAKRIIKLINAVGDVVNRDPVSRDVLKVVFLPDFRVSLGQKVYPVADLSEQISTAGKEASGTGNMKFSLNGALTIGTLDGANVEIRECVGAENFFLFGMTAEEAANLGRSGYNPHRFYDRDDELREAIEALRSGVFSDGDRMLFQPIVDNLIYSDPFMLLADYRSYIDCQGEVDRAWKNPNRWTKMSILNSARCGMFSSDRAIQQYCDDIWHTSGSPVDLVQRATEYCLL
jgi:starch phosphorylase